MPTRISKIFRRLNNLFFPDVVDKMKAALGENRTDIGNGFTGHRSDKSIPQTKLVYRLPASKT